MSKETIFEFKAGQRLDKVLAEHFKQYSRSALLKLIDGGLVTVNGQPKKASYKLKPTDTIEVDTSHFKTPPPTLKIPIIYEDDEVVVINKPAGVLTHSKGALNVEATIASFIQPKLNGSTDWRQTNRAGIVHRLDRVTSGIMIIAKTEAAQTWLQKQFANRRVQKIYVAQVSGHLPAKSGLIDVPIERNPKKPATFRAGSNGKPAQTNFTVLKQAERYSLVELKPITGRTHQLRVHLAYLKHPIVGDELYGGQPARRLLLHAQSLELTLPSGEIKRFEAPVPPEIKELVG